MCLSGFLSVRTTDLVSFLVREIFDSILLELVGECF